MSRHLYMVGDEVVFGRNSGTFSPKAVGAYTIKAQLPPLGDHLQYRIKSAIEPHERVVLEHQISAGESIVAGAPPATGDASVTEDASAPVKKSNSVRELERSAMRKQISLAPISGIT